MVYLIHLAQPFQHACHYLGFVEKNLKQRLQRHESGQGSKMLRAVRAAGISWTVVRIWPDGDRNFERQLKNGGHSPQLCPVCNPKNHLNHAKQYNTADRRQFKKLTGIPFEGDLHSAKCMGRPNTTSDICAKSTK